MTADSDPDRSRSDGRDEDGSTRRDAHGETNDEIAGGDADRTNRARPDGGSGLTGSSGLTESAGLDASARFGRPIVTGALVVVVLFLLAPIVITIVSSFARSAAGFWPRGFVDVENYRRVFGLTEAGIRGLDDGLLFSIGLATGGMLINIVVGVPIAYALTRYDFFARDWLNAFAILPLVPGVILALAFIRAYPNHASTWLGLIVGYALLKSPYMVLTVQSSFQSMDLQQLEESARSLGASWPRTFLTVIVPNAKDGILAGSIITWTLAAAEFNFTYMVYSRGPEPFSLFLLRYIEGPYMEGAAAVTIYFCIVVTAILVLQLVGNRGFTTQG